MIHADPPLSSSRVRPRQCTACPEHSTKVADRDDEHGLEHRNRQAIDAPTGSGIWSHEYFPDAPNPRLRTSLRVPQ